VGIVGGLLLCGGPAHGALLVYNSAIIGAPEGLPASVTCPSGHYLAGIAIRTDPFFQMSGLVPYCVAMAPDGGWSGWAQIDPNMQMGPASLRSDPGWREMFCPRDFYLFAFKGYTKVFDWHELLQLRLSCRNPKTGELRPNSVGTPSQSVSSVMEWPWEQCGAEAVANGVVGKIDAAENIIQFGLSCAATRPAMAGQTSGKTLGRVQGSPIVTPFVSICDSAQSARGRNSPAAPDLEAQCRAFMATKGEAIANREPLSAELRRRTRNDLARRGFDLGMTVAENNTEMGPGKQAMHNALTGIEQAAFDVAVSFSLQRNRNAPLATTGAAIAAADPSVEQARKAQNDVFYWLGFDIATGIFGDPARGAGGHTQMGPGAAKIRDALDATTQSGFNAAVAFHLNRKYQ
jgi:hypothetical protein